MFITVQEAQHDGDNLRVIGKCGEIEKTLRLGIRDLSKHGIVAAAIGKGSILELTTTPCLGTDRVIIVEINLYPPARPTPPAAFKAPNRLMALPA